MALKADRYELQTDISFFYDAGTATRGGVVCHGTAGSGAAMDQGVALVEYSTVAQTSKPVGILLNDVVNKDLTRTHLNQHKNEVQKGGKVTVLRKGYVVTNTITGTPAVGDVAIVAVGTTAGTITPLSDATFRLRSSGVDGPGSGHLAVGRFMSTKDEDGYAKVEINLPSVSN
jgi:hypothetical protein